MCEGTDENGNIVCIQCDTENNGAFENNGDGTCSLTCNANYFTADGSNYESCGSNCAVCSDVNTCDTCTTDDNGSFENNGDGSCTIRCDDGYHDPNHKCGYACGDWNSLNESGKETKWSVCVADGPLDRTECLADGRCREYAAKLVADALKEAGITTDADVELVAGTIVIDIDEVDDCGDVDQQAVADGIVRDILAASENIGQEPLAVTTYCQENDDGAAAGGNAP